jgi:hypothetical protein
MAARTANVAGPKAQGRRGLLGYTFVLKERLELI